MNTKDRAAPDRAVVIGGSLAGLMAATAAAEHFEQVVMIERDRFPDDPQPRRGVPQSRQLHGLLGRGAQAMDGLYPGLIDELRTAGAVGFDVLGDVDWYLDGRKLAAATTGMINYGCSRPLVDHLILRRVRELPSVEVRDGIEVRGLVTDGDRVTGVRTAPASSQDAEEELVEAALVIDASGRGTRSPARLEESGYPRAPKSEVRADVVYLTRRYHADAGDKPRRVTWVPYPDNPRGGVIVHEENDQLCLVLFGLVGYEPPVDDVGMLRYAEEIGNAELIGLIKNGTPLGDPVRMRYPASVRQHPERLDRLPAGFLFLGDSLTSFNPTYGQGMTTAALQAELLQELLADGRDRLPERFYPAAAKIIDGAWQLAVGGDLRFPQVEGRRTLADGLINRYLDRLRRAATVDPRLGLTFQRVANMLAPASALMSPQTVLRTLTARP